MNNKIREHLITYNQKMGYGIGEDELFETLFEANEVYRGDYDSHRWWTTCLIVVDINGMFIGYEGAETTGDESASEKGWEFDPETIHEYIPVERTIISYVEV